MIGFGFKILTRTPVSKLPRDPPPTPPSLKLFNFCLCKLCAIILFATSCPNYALWMTRYHLELLNSDEAQPTACAMLGTGAMSIRRTNKPFFNPHSTGRRFRYAHGDLGFSLKLFQIAAEA